MEKLNISPEDWLNINDWDKLVILKKALSEQEYANVVKDWYISTEFIHTDLQKWKDTFHSLKKPELLQTEAPKVDPKVAELNKKKQTAKVSAKIEASQQQPPAMKGEGAALRGDKPVDLNKLSEKEFNALPEETLKRLRGDFG